jgi:hypothetical protein
MVRGGLAVEGLTVSLVVSNFGHGDLVLQGYKKRSV